jgi:hypothetical protein
MTFPAVDAAVQAVVDAAVAPLNANLALLTDELAAANTALATARATIATDDQAIAVRDSQIQQANASIATLTKQVADLTAQLGTPTPPPPPVPVPPAKPSFLVGAASDNPATWATLEQKTGRQRLIRVYDDQFTLNVPALIKQKIGLTDLAGRTIIYSCKPPAGIKVADIQTLLASAKGLHVIFSMQHEASNPGKPFTTAAQQAQLKADWAVFATAVHAAGFETIWIEMDFTWQSASKRVPENYWPGDDHVDYVGIDTYNNGSLNNPQRWDSYGYALGAPANGESLSHVGGSFVEGGFLGWIKAKGKPWFVTEWNTIRQLGAGQTRADYLTKGVDYFRAAGAEGVIMFEATGRTSKVTGESWPLRNDADGSAYAAWAAVTTAHLT